LNNNTLQYTIDDSRYAVSHHSDGYSGLCGGATSVTAYRGTAIAALHYSGAAVRGGLLHRWLYFLQLPLVFCLVILTSSKCARIDVNNYVLIPPVLTITLPHSIQKINIGEQL